MAEPLMDASMQAAPNNTEPESADIDEQRLINALEANIVEADTIQGSEISEQRQRNHIYYAMDRLGNEEKNRSHHISGDVIDAVEGQKAYYLESYFSGRRVCKFEAEDQRDQFAGHATAYVDQVFRENHGYEFTRDSLHDAMVAKKAVAYVYWEDDDEEVVEQLEPMPANQIAALEEQGEVEVIDRIPVLGPGGILVKATIRRFEDTSGTRVELVQPERFYRDPNVAYVRDAAFAGFQEDLQRYEVIDRGYVEKEVNELNLDYRFRQNEEDAARKAHDSTWSRARRHKRPAEMEIVTIYTSFCWLDLANYASGGESTRDSLDGVRLYKFVWSQGNILTQENGQKYEEVADGMPFVEWTQYPIAHSEYGLCEADVMSDIQWSKSNLYRLIINNQAMVNSTRYKAKHGMIKNPRELLDNNIGSTLWMSDPERDLVPMPTVPLSNATFQTIEGLDTEKENRSGQSRLSKGLNADAISNQNADSMIERLTNASNRRVMRGVRDFAETYWKPIFCRIYDLGQKYDEKPRWAEIAGQWTQLAPQQWPKRTKCLVNVALTPEQAAKQAMFLLQMNDRWIEDPEMKVLYGVEQKHALYDDVCEMMGVSDTSRYMKRPSDPQVQKAMAKAGQEGAKMKALQDQMLAMQGANMRLQMQLDAGKGQRDDMLGQVSAIESQANIADLADDNRREDAKLELERDEAAAEYELERTQRRPVAID